MNKNKGSDDAHWLSLLAQFVLVFSESTTHKSLRVVDDSQEQCISSLGQRIRNLNKFFTPARKTLARLIKAGFSSRVVVRNVGKRGQNKIGEAI